MIEVNVFPGIRGARTIGAAYADVALRKRGVLPPIVESVGRRDQPPPWTDSQYDEALALKMKGKTSREIAKAIRRTVKSVERKFSYRRSAT